MHRVSSKQPSVDSQEELESCLIKDRTTCTTNRELSSQSSHCSSGGGERSLTDGYVLEASGASEDSGVNEGAESTNEEEQTAFCVGDVRKRLTQHSSAPRKMFQRDPNDPSGKCG